MILYTDMTKILDPWTELPDFIDRLPEQLMCEICERYPVTQDNNTICNKCIRVQEHQKELDKEEGF